MSDLHFDRALRGAARRGRPEGVCPDAAALASYVDRSLSPAEHAALEAHVASCPACMEHLALLAAVDAPEAPADPSDAWSFERIFGSWRWLVPVATVVLVVAVWLRLPASREAALPVSLEKTAEAPTPVTSAPPAGGAPAQGSSGDKPAELEQFADARARRDAAGKLEASRQKTSEAGRLQSAQVDAFKQKERDEEAANERKNLAVAGLRPVAAPAPPPPPPAAPAPQVVEEAKAGAGARTEARAAADGAARPEAKDAKAPAVADTVAVPSAPGVMGGQARAMRKTVAAPLFEVTAPGVRLRVAGGRFDRSSDGGATWTTERTGVATRVLSGDCLTAEVCWLAGEAGEVFVRAADGTWAERPIADAQVGVVTITSSSRDAATATLADGRRFSTTDGGRTWTLAQ